jgi:hypothetical protein
VSWQLVTILFAIAAFEGVRQLGPDELVLRCNPLGAWRVVSPLQLWRDWHFVSFLPPFFLTIVIPPGMGANLVSNRENGIADLPQSSRTVLALRVFGALDFLLLIVGIPWAVSRFGAIGLIVSLGGALALSVATAIASGIRLTSEGMPRRIAVRKAMSFASPFASPLAAETVLSARIRRYPRLTAISQLLGDIQFHAWIRPCAYDLHSRRPSTTNAWLEEIASSLPVSERARILDSASEGCSLEERYCPRCGEKYLLESSHCTECDGIALRLRDQRVG